MTTYDSDILYDSDLTFDGASSSGWLQLDDGETRLVFNTGADDDGVEWWATSVGGWDSPDVRSPRGQRASAHGLYLSTFFHGGRSLELAGHIVCPTTALAYSAKTLLAALVNVDRDLVLTVFEDECRQVVARRSDRLLLRQTDGLVEFQIPLVAADPRKYGCDTRSLAVGTATDATATNHGTIDAFATATITGPVGTPTLVNVSTGDELPVDIALAAGEQLDVDFDLHLVTVGGASVRSALLSGYRWWTLAPGDNVVRLEGYGTDGGTRLELRWRDAWI